VWIPKRRKGVLKGKIASRVKELFYEACHLNKWWIGKLGIKEDHIHMLIQIKPRESIAYVVQKLKGGSSRKLRKEYPDLDEFVWGDSFWCDGYFAVTVGEVEAEVVERYIQSQ
jgi:putative transposase